MYYHSSVIQSLEEENRHFDKLLTRTRQLLREHDVNFARQQLTDTLKPLIDYHIISKEKKGTKVVYSLNSDANAKEGISLIMAISSGSEQIDENQWLVEQYEQSVENIRRSNPVNSKKLFSEITTKLIEFSKFLFSLWIRILYFQNQSMKLPFLETELRQQERRTRIHFDRVSLIAKNLGYPYYPKFLDRLDVITAKETKRDFDKFTKDNYFFRNP